MKTRLSIVMVVVAATVAQAQYATNAWPPWRYQREGWLHAQDCYSAIVERCVAVGVANPPAPSFFRSQVQNCIDDKTKLRELIPYYADPSKHSTSNGFATYLETKLSKPVYGKNQKAGTETGRFLLDFTNSASIPNLSIPSAFYQVHLPTNFLDYTTDRALLSGTGPFDNGTHGWTNATTAAGGRIYPAGRTCWYTSDYGWAGVTALVSLLQYTVATECWTNHGESNVCGFVGHTGQGFDYWTNSQFLSEWQWQSIEVSNVYLANLIPERHTWGYLCHLYGRPMYVSDARASYSYLEVSDICTTIAHKAEFYPIGFRIGYIWDGSDLVNMSSIPYPYPPDDPGDMVWGNEFDCNIQEGWQLQLSQEGCFATTNTRIGPQDITVFPEWCDEPTVDNGYLPSYPLRGKNLGWAADGRAAVRWTGFKFK